MDANNDFQDFCEELRAKSSKIHATSDRLVQLKLAVALTDTKLYAKVLGDFYLIFKAIEDSVKDNLDNQCLCDLWTDKLSRTQAIENDLAFYLGLGWKDFVQPSNAVLDYVSRIQDVSLNEPVLLVSYVHTMYLAIFSGGFILRKIVRNTLGLHGDGGLAIFDLPYNVSRKEMKDHIKSTINKMDLNREIKDKIIQEKISIFKRNNEIVKSIQPKVSSYKRLIKFAIGVVLLIILFLYILAWLVL